MSELKENIDIHAVSVYDETLKNPAEVVKCFMQKIAVHEITPFDTAKESFPFFIDVTFRKIKPMPYTGIFHYHESPELIFCHSGKMKITLLEGEIILEPGDFLFINSNIPHSTDPYEGENEHYYIKFDAAVLDIKASRPLPNPKHFLYLLSDYSVFRNSKESEQIHALFQRCVDNFSHNNFTKRLILQASVMEIMAYVFERGLENPSAEETQNNKVLLDTAEFINQNYTTVTLEKAAKNASMSYSYFSRLFKKFFNTSFSKYVSKIRVEKSLSLLSNSSLSITEIALECGFSNLSHYVKCFKAEKGITPNKFRSLVKKRDQTASSRP